MTQYGMKYFQPCPLHVPCVRIHVHPVSTATQGDVCRDAAAMENLSRQNNLKPQHPGECSFLGRSVWQLNKRFIKSAGSHRTGQQEGPIRRCSSVRAWPSTGMRAMESFNSMPLREGNWTSERDGAGTHSQPMLNWVRRHRGVEAENNHKWRELGTMFRVSPEESPLDKREHESEKLTHQTRNPFAQRQPLEGQGRRIHFNIDIDSSSYSDAQDSHARLANRLLLGSYLPGRPGRLLSLRRSLEAEECKPDKELLQPPSLTRTHQQQQQRGLGSQHQLSYVGLGPSDQDKLQPKDASTEPRLYQNSGLSLQSRYTSRTPNEKHRRYDTKHCEMADVDETWSQGAVSQGNWCSPRAEVRDDKKTQVQQSVTSIRPLQVNLRFNRRIESAKATRMHGSSVADGCQEELLDVDGTVRGRPEGASAADMHHATLTPAYTSIESDLGMCATKLMQQQQLELQQFQSDSPFYLQISQSIAFNSSEERLQTEDWKRRPVVEACSTDATIALSPILVPHQTEAECPDVAQRVEILQGL